MFAVTRAIWRPSWRCSGGTATAPGTRRCWSASFGFRPRRPPRPAGRRAALVAPPCSRQEAARWPPAPLVAAGLWENLAAGRRRWIQGWNGGESPSGLRCSNQRLLTLVDVEEGLAEVAGENGLGQVPEILLHHVGYVEGGVALVGDAAGVRLHQVAQQLDTRLRPRLPEEPHLAERAEL